MEKAVSNPPQPPKPAKRASYTEWLAGRKMRLELLRRQRKERRAAISQNQSMLKPRTKRMESKPDVSMRQMPLAHRAFPVDLRTMWRLDPYLLGLLAGYLGIRETFSGLLPSMAAAKAFSSGATDSSSVRYADVADDLFDLREKSPAGFEAMAKLGLGDLRAAELIEALKHHVKTRRNLHADLVAIRKLMLTDTSGRQPAQKVQTNEGSRT